MTFLLNLPDSIIAERSPACPRQQSFALFPTDDKTFAAMFFGILSEFHKGFLLSSNVSRVGPYGDTCTTLAVELSKYSCSTFSLLSERTRNLFDAAQTHAAQNRHTRRTIAEPDADD